MLCYGAMISSFHCILFNDGMVTSSGQNNTTTKNVQVRRLGPPEGRTLKSRSKVKRYLPKFDASKILHSYTYNSKMIQIHECPVKLSSLQARILVISCHLTLKSRSKVKRDLPKFDTSKILYSHSYRYE